MKQNDCLKLRPRGRLTILLEGLDWTADDDELYFVKHAYKDGLSVPDMAEKLNRDVDEVGIMVTHLCRKGIIIPRPSGFYGAAEWERMRKR